MPDAIKYRHVEAVCPLLKNGLCSVYERRPFGCREFYAQGNPADCDLPHRTHQKFAKFGTALFRAAGVPVAVNGKVVIDHLGVLLAAKLIDPTYRSGSYQEMPAEMLHMPPL